MGGIRHQLLVIIFFFLLFFLLLLICFSWLIIQNTTLKCLCKINSSILYVDILCIVLILTFTSTIYMVKSIFKCKGILSQNFEPRYLKLSKLLVAISALGMQMAEILLISYIGLVVLR